MARSEPDITFVEFKVLSFGSDEEFVASYGSLTAARAAWESVREPFLGRWNLWGMPQAWWRFEPGVPEELRTGPALILTDAHADEWRSIDMARRLYLVSLGIEPRPDRSGPFARPSD